MVAVSDTSVIYDIDVNYGPCQVSVMNNDADSQSFHLATVLAERVKAAARAPKRTRTRLGLLAATAAEMEIAGYHGLTTNGIVDRAGLARGTFYLYFANRAEAAFAVIRAFNALMRRKRPRGGKALPPFDAIYRMNLFYVDCYWRNAVLLAGKEALMRDKPEMARERDFLNHRWARAILRDLVQRTGASGSVGNDPSAVLAVRIVIAMADEILREAYIYRTPLLEPLTRDRDQFARVLSFVWYRAVFGCDPKGVEAPLPSIANLFETVSSAGYSAAPRR